jgi:8-oxo-dGTP pyrophosphatase MutT (NUDIX family)
MDDVVQPRPAATVVVVRDGPAGVEAYLQRRPRTMGFAGGLWVFPGGRIDQADGDAAVDAVWDGPPPAAWAERMSVDAGQARRYLVAACRETFEEAGMLLADRQPDLAALLAARGDLLGGERGFAAMLGRMGVRLDTSRLRYWAWWLTPEREPRRYDTRFFVAALPPGVTASAEGLTEVERECWLPPGQAAEDQSMPMLPPTYFTLRELAGYQSVEELLEAGRDRPVEQVLPRLEGHVLIMPWDERYPVPAAPPDHGTGS